MQRFAHIRDDGTGRKVVRAVSERSVVIGAPINGSVPVPAELHKHILGYTVEDGKFREIGYREKLARKECMKNAQIKQIVWCFRDFDYGNSLSHVSRESVRWLAKEGIPVKAMTWDWNLVPPELPPAKPEDLATSAVIVMDRVPPPNNMFDILKSAPVVLGYYMLEGSKVRKDVASRLEVYDAILTPSEFCKTALDDILSIKTFVWGHGIDPEIYPYTKKQPNRPFTYLWFGDENRRKGYDLFLEAFSKIRVQNVRALVRGPGSGMLAREGEKYKKDRRIVWDTRVTPPEQMKELMAEADVIVCPLRGEGFALCPLEAMASGLPAIMTRWSGPLDFGCDDLTYWVDISGYEPSQNDDGVQAVPNMNHLINQMTRCAENPKEVVARGVQCSRYVHENWTWGKKVREILPILRQLIPVTNFHINV